jgi:hypothetical protein
LTCGRSADFSPVFVDLIVASFQFWVLAPHGEDGHRLMSDEHQCLSAAEELGLSGQWRLQLRECGEHGIVLGLEEEGGIFVA